MKAKVLFLCFQFLFFASPLFAREDKSDDRARNKEVMKLLKEEEKILEKRVKRERTAIFLWQLMKVKMEKYRFTHKKENKRFISAPIKVIKKRGKKWFFRQSHALYKEIRRLGLEITKRWPRFKSNEEVYYALAINTLNHNDPKIIKKELGHFLNKVLRITSSETPLFYDSLVKLSEHYYNQKNYKKAVSSYRRLLKSKRIKKDQWATKHFFNLSWCYLETGHPNKGLKMLMKSLSLGKKKIAKGEAYIDYSKQIFESLPLFFVRSNKIKSGISFFKKNQKDSRASILKMAAYSRDVGKEKETVALYNSALQESKKRKDRDKVIFIMIEKMDFFSENKNYKSFSTTVSDLVKEHTQKKLKDKDRQVVIDKIKRFVGARQDILKRSEETKKKISPIILFYFDKLKVLDPDQFSYYSFHQGEALFGDRRYEKAIPYYYKGIESFKKKKNKDQKGHELAKKTFESIFASLERMKIKKAKKMALSLQTYRSYLSLYPVSKQSPAVYQRLFNLYFKKKDTEKAKSILALYHKNYKNHEKEQRFMFTQLFDAAASKKDLKAMAFWIHKMKVGYLNFGSDSLKKAYGVMSEIVFKSALDEKNLEISTKHHEKIFFNQRVSRSYSI